MQVELCSRNPNSTGDVLQGSQHAASNGSSAAPLNIAMQLTFKLTLLAFLSL